MIAITNISKATYITVGVMIAFVLLGVVVIFTLLNQSRQATLTESVAGQAFAQNPENYTDLAGNQVSLDDMLGQPFVVTSWASWCPHCYADLQSIDTILADFPTVRALGINRRESKTQITRYLRSQPTLDRVELFGDSSDQFFTSVQGYTMPETLVFDATGDVVYHARGAVEATQLRQALETTTEQ